MTGEKKKGYKNKTDSGQEGGEMSAEKSQSGESMGNNGGLANEEHASANSDIMQAIHNEFKMLRETFKTDLGEFQLSFRDDMRKELNEFREEINQKLKDTTGELLATNTRVSEAEQRIADIEEEWGAAAKEALAQALEKQDALQAKIIDLEARSRRNNLRIYGIPEGEEGTDLLKFVTELIKTKLGSPVSDMELGIQRCHRALAPKPPADAPPRSLVLCFLEFKVKEQVIHTAWKKKDVRCGEKRIFFDQDYPPEIQKKRKAYVGILKALKARGVRFQTPYPAKLKVFFDNGIQTYESAANAFKDLKKRGLPLDDVTEPGQTEPKQPRPGWERAGPTREGRRRDRQAGGAADRFAVTQERIRDRLRSFQHDRGAKE